jgi:hypothetical protein
MRLIQLPRRLASLLLVAASLALPACASDKVSSENYDKIGKGMSEDDVTALLGPPTRTDESLGRTLIWDSGSDRLAVTFLHGKLFSKRCTCKGEDYSETFSRTDAVEDQLEAQPPAPTPPPVAKAPQTVEVTDPPVPAPKPPARKVVSRVQNPAPIPTPAPIPPPTDVKPVAVKPQTKERKTYANPFLRAKAAVASEMTRETSRPGVAQDKPYQELPPEGALLIGLEVTYGESFNHKVLSSIQPIFQSASETYRGRRYGSNSALTTRAEAKKGYAVGAVNVKSGIGADGLSLTFMRIKGDGLDPTDSYESPWMGGKKGDGKPTVLAGDGTPVIGIFGSAGKDPKKAGVVTIGLILPADEK